MKTKLLIALAALALLMPITANARGRDHNPPRVAPRHHVQHPPRVAPRHHDNRPPRHHRMVHRPAIGTRLVVCPVNGRFVNYNRERLWLADGVLYRVTPTRTGRIYVVVGYWN